MTETATKPAPSVDPQLLARGLWRIGGGSWNARTASLSAEADANVYLIASSDCLALVDAGTRAGLPLIRRNLERTGVSDGGRVPTDLLLTHSHFDHTEASRDWQAVTRDLRTHLSSIGSAFLDRGDHRLVGYQINPPPHGFDVFHVDHPVGDNETFELGAGAATAYHLPGHTPDSTLYTVRHEGLTLGFCGDVVFRPRAADRPLLGQLCSLWLSNLDDYVCSLRRLRDIELDVLLPGHGEPVRGATSVRVAVEQALRLALELSGDERIRENVGV